MTFEFIADRPSLDFVATVAERGTTDLDKLCSADDLAEWVQESGIVQGRPAVTSAQLHQALVMREAIFGLLRALIDGEPVRSADRILVNRAAAQPGPSVQLSKVGTVRRRGDVDSVLAVLARDCLNLFDSPDRHSLHWCADPRCTHPFIDRSRGQRRRWCDMKGCGDRAKAAAYRRRHRLHAPARPDGLHTSLAPTSAGRTAPDTLL